MEQNIRYRNNGGNNNIFKYINTNINLSSTNNKINKYINNRGYLPLNKFSASLRDSGLRDFLNHIFH